MTWYVKKPVRQTRRRLRKTSPKDYMTKSDVKAVKEWLVAATIPTEKHVGSWFVIWGYFLQIELGFSSRWMKPNQVVFSPQHYRFQPANLGMRDVSYQTHRDWKNTSKQKWYVCHLTDRKPEGWSEGLLPNQDVLNLQKERMNVEAETTEIIIWYAAHFCNKLCRM